MSESSSEARSLIEVSDADIAAAAASAEETTAEDAEVSEETGGPFSQKTAWVRRMETPLRSFLRTETGSASVLAAATVLALIWANMSISSYEKFWSTRLSVTIHIDSPFATTVGPLSLSQLAAAGGAAPAVGAKPYLSSSWQCIGTDTLVTGGAADSFSGSWTFTRTGPG